MLVFAQAACLPTPPETTGTAASTGDSATTDASVSISASSTSAGQTSASTSGDTDGTSGSDGTSAGSDGTSGSSDGSTTECNFICDDPTCGDGEAFIPGPGLSPRCLPPLEECDAWLQDCPEGEKCSAYAADGESAWNALRCVPVDGDAKPGEPCLAYENPLTGLDSCELGAMCWSVDEETLEGVCVGLCDGSPDESTCAEPGTSCKVSNGGVLNLCLDDCHPLAKECDEGDACVFVEDSFSCTPGGIDGIGEPCNGATCTDGQSCFPAPYLPECQSGSCCTPYCDVTADDPCPDLEGSTCVSFFMDEPPEGLENVGSCVFPP
jgi:hypothetical protein